jgi:ProP effector
VDVQSGQSTAANDAWRRTESGRNIKRRAMALRVYLLRRFPNAFMPFKAPKIPLKLGIRKDIRLAEPTIGWNQLQLALEDYCNGRTYLRALVPGAPRIDLLGDVVGVVTAEEARRAAYQLQMLEVHDGVNVNKPGELAM